MQRRLHTTHSLTKRDLLEALKQCSDDTRIDIAVAHEDLDARSVLPWNSATAPSANPKLIYPMTLSSEYLYLGEQDVLVIRAIAIPPETEH